MCERREYHRAPLKSIVYLTELFFCFFITDEFHCSFQLRWKIILISVLKKQTGKILNIMVALFKAGRMVLFIQSLQVIKEIPPGLIYPRALLLKKSLRRSVRGLLHYYALPAEPDGSFLIRKSSRERPAFNASSIGFGERPRPDQNLTSPFSSN